VTSVKAVFWDFGGVITSSPFEAFSAYEDRIGVENGAIRRINTVNPNENAWARFERNEIDRQGFCDAFGAEAAALGYKIDGAAVLNCLAGEPRPIMVRALQTVRRSFLIACLTNNVAKTPRPPDQTKEIERIMGLFHHVVESSKLGFRKPERRFYEHALNLAGVDASETVFLDDLGVNLKTARAMGMTTIKVTQPESALSALEDILGVNLLNDG